MPHVQNGHGQRNRLVLSEKLWQQRSAKRTPSNNGIAIDDASTSNNHWNLRRAEHLKHIAFANAQIRRRCGNDTALPRLIAL